MGLLIRFIVTFIAVLVADLLLRNYGFSLGSTTNAVIFAAVLALLNALVRPVIAVLTCPIQIATLGLAMLVINALLFLLAGSLANAVGASGVQISGFVPAFVAALLVSIVSTIVSMVIRR